MYHDSAFYKSTLQNFINMTHQNTLKEINNKLSELTHRFEKLSSSDEIHLIDVDILLDMMRELYVKTSLLKEPVKTEEIIAEPASTHFATPIPMVQPEIASDFAPHTPEAVVSHEAAPEADWSEEAVPTERTPIFPQVSHYEEQYQPEAETPEIEIPQPQQEIVQRQPEVVFPQPETVKQDWEMIQPKSEYLHREPEVIQPSAPEPVERYTPPTPSYQPPKAEFPHREPEVIQPPTPEPVAPPVAPPPSYQPPKPVVHQSDLFGNGSLSDKYKTEAPSINDKITTGKPDHTLADKINLVPISDIKSAIGINEKFQFINELFDGSSQLYNDTIALLNNCTGAETAHALLHDFQTRHKWDSENKAFLKFREYIERRYLHS